MNRMTWRTIDHAATRWAALLAVAAVVAAILAAVRFVGGQVAEAIAATVLLLVVLFAWWAMYRLRNARVTIDASGIRREGRGGFSFGWDTIRMAGIGSGLVGGDAPYLLLATTRRRTHRSIIPAAGSGFTKPSAAVPVDPGMVEQLEQLLSERGVLRTAEQWSAEI